MGKQRIRWDLLEQQNREASKVLDAQDRDPLKTIDYISNTQRQPKVLSEAKIHQADEEGIDKWKRWQPGYDVDKALADLQTGGQAAWRAIGGGLYKGAFTFLEDTGYLLDAGQWTGIADEADEGETNWLSDWAKEQKQEYDAYNPIYSKGTGSFGWWMQNVQGVVDSVVGFGLTGGLAGAGIKGMINGTRYLKAMEKVGAITEAQIARLGTAAATNYAESKMMASEMYKNIYYNALAEGISHDKASEMAEKEAKEFIWKNKLNIATDYVALKHLTNGKDIISGNTEKTLKQQLSGHGKVAVTEAFEEATQGFLQREGERDASLEMDLQDTDNTSYVDRAYNYITSEEGWREAMLGAIGGPFQSGAAAATGKAAEVVKKKLGVKESGMPTPPSEFDMPPPEDPGVELPQEPKAPKTVEEQLREKHPEWSEEQIKTRAQTSKHLQNQYKAEKSEYDKKKKVYDQSLEAKTNYEKELEKYQNKKKEHEKQTEEYKKKIAQWTAEKEIGKKAKTVEDIASFLKNEQDLQKKYQKALLQGDDAKMKDIENERFEGLFMRYAQRGATDALEAQLEELSKDPESSQEQRAKANEYLQKLETYSKEYLKAFDKHSKSGLTEPVFRTRMRMINTQEALDNINKDIMSSKESLSKALLDVEGKDMSLDQQELLSLKAEQRELKKIENSLRNQFNPKLKTQFDRKQKEFETRVSNLETTLKELDKENLIDASVLSSFQELQDLEQKAKDRANAWVAFKSYENLYSYLTSSNFERDAREANNEYLRESLESAVSSRDLDVLQRQSEMLDLTSRQRKQLEKDILQKRTVVYSDEQKAVQEYQRKKDAYRSLRKQQDEIINDLKTEYGKLGSAQKRMRTAEEQGREYEAREAIIDKNRAMEKIRTLKEAQNNIEDLANSSVYDMSAYEGLPSSEAFEFDPAESKPVTDKKFKEEKALDDHGPEPGYERDLTEKEISKAEDVLKRKAIQTNDVTDHEKAIKATETKTNKSILESDVSDDTIFTEANPNIPVISPEAQAKQQEIKDGYEFSIAYVSQTDNVGKNDIALTDWLETTPDTDKRGTKLRFYVDKSDRSFSEEAFDRFSKGEALSDSDIATLPIRIQAYNESGDPLLFGGKKVYGWLRTAFYDFKNDSDNKRARVLEARRKLVKALKDGGTYETQITEIGRGILHTSTEQKDPRQHVDKVEIVMSDGNRGLVKGKYRKERQVDERFENVITEGGFPYLVTQTPSGDYFPLRLNSRRINQTEADVIYKLFYAITKGFKPNQVIENVPEVRGLTYRQAIDLLVYEGRQSVNKKYPFLFDLKNKVVQFGNTIVSFEDFPTHQEAFKIYTQGLVRTTDSSLINKKLSSKFNDDFEWFGQTIDIDLDYNDFLMNDGSLTTNALFPKDRLFVNPYVKFESFEDWKPIGVKVQETPKKKSKSVETKTEFKEKSPLPNKKLGEDPLFGKLDPKFDYSPDENFTDEQKDTLSEEAIESTKKDTDKTKGPVEEDDLSDIDNWKTLDDDDNLFEDTDDDFEPKFSSYQGRTKPINVEKELSDLQNILPNVPAHVYKGLLRVPGGIAEGAFYKGVIVLSDAGNKGVAYHEAFHAVSQMYLSPEARVELYTEARKRYGKNLKYEEVEEVLAEEFREYMLSRGTLKVPEVFRWIYDLMLDLINLFRTKQGRLFANIRAGRFDYDPPFISSAELTSRLPYPMDFVRTAVDVATYAVVKDSGVLSFDRDSSDFGSMNQAFDKVKLRFQTWAKKAKDAGDLEKAKNFAEVVRNWDRFKDLVQDELVAYNLAERIDDTDIQEEAVITEDETFEEDYKSEGLNIKSSLQFSGKDNATGNTKLLVSLLPLTERDNYFGLPRFANFSKTWRLLEDNLSNIVAAGGKTAPELMTAKLESLAIDHPFINSLVNKLKDPDFPQFKKTQFFNTFSKQSVLYNNTIGKKTTKDTYEWFAGNADTQNQASQIREGWLETFKYENVDSDGLQNKAALKKVVEEYKSFENRVKQVGNDVDLSKVYTYWKQLLNKAGLDITEQALKAFTLEQRGSQEITKLNNAVGKVSYAFVNKGNNISLEAMLGKYTWDDEANFISDNSVFQQIAKSQAQFSKIPGENSVLGPNGNTYWTKSLNNNMSKTTASWKANPEAIKHLRSKAYHKYSEWLRTLDEDPEALKNFNIEVFLANRLQDEGDPGTTYMDLTNPDEMVNRIVHTLSGVTNKQGLGSIYSPLTFADKSSWYLMSGIPVKKFSIKAQERPGGYDWYIPKRVTDIVYNYILAELDRIAYAVENKVEVQNYKGTELFWFPELNKGTDLANELELYDHKGKPIINDTLRNRIRPYIESVLTQRFEAMKNKMIDLNIMGNDNTITGVSDSILKYYQSQNEVKGREAAQTTRASYELIGDYVMNSVIANIEFTMLYSGDPAFYKDLSKRTPAVIATGQDLMDVDGVPLNFKVAVVDDIEEESSLYKEYLEAYKKAGVKNPETVLAPYRENNQADAQAYITPSRFRSIMIGLGKWEPKHQSAYDKLIKGERVSPKELLAMTPLKGMHFELREEGDIVVPTYLKYSQAILWPQLVKGTKLERVLDKMNKEGIDELVFNSGIKVGAGETASMQMVMEGKFDSPFNSITLSNFNWKLQQDLPTKYEKTGEALVGSQVRKNIMANLKGKNILYKGETITGEDIAKQLHEVESQISNLGRQDLSRRWSIKNEFITDWSGVRESLVKKFKRDRTNSNIIEQVEKEFPFDAIFQHKEKIEQELHATVTKDTVKLKAPGAALVQMSNVGLNPVRSFADSKMDPNSITWFLQESELQGPRIENGKVKSAQVLIPFKMIRNIPNYKNLTPAELKDHIDPSVLEGLIGYRIPNQGLSSIDSIEIAGILPPSAGDTIVTYTEVTSKTGSDFDIDKMFVMMPHVHYNEETGQLERISSDSKSRKGYENKRLELWDAILRSPDSFVELTSPLDSEWLKDDAYYIALLNESRTNPGIWNELGMNQEEFVDNPKRKVIASEFYKNRKLKGLEFASPDYQFDAKIRNAAGKAGVGQTANHLTHHALAQQAELRLRSSLPVGNVIEGNVDLSQTLNETGQSITSVISSWLNAYVDNAKDPYISLINNNTFTANSVFMLLRAGADPNWVNRFMSQPILQDLSKEYFTSQSKILSPEFKSFTKLIVNRRGEVTKKDVDNAPLSYTDKVLNKWTNDLTLSQVPVVVDKTFTDKELEDQITNPDLDTQLQVLVEFLRMRWLASKLNDAVRASKQDTQGASSNAADNLASRELYDQVVSEGIVENFENLFDNTFLGTFKKNSETLSDKIFKRAFFSKSAGVEQTVKSISMMVGKQYATDGRLNKKVISDLYSYMYSGSDMIRVSQNKIRELFQGKKSLAHKVAAIKQMEQFKDNDFIQALGTKLSPDNGLSFVTMASSKHKDRTDADNLWLRWEEMFSDDTIITKDYTVKNLAEDLVTYAFYASGFKKNINSFYDLIPNTYMNGEIPGTKTDGQSLSEYVQDMYFFDGVYTDFIDQFFRHNWEDDTLVPRISDKQIMRIDKGVGKKEGIALAADSFPSKANISTEEGIVRPASYIKTKVENNQYLYKYMGYRPGQYIYERVEALGTKEKGNVIVEYAMDEEVRSFIHEPAPGLRQDIKEQLDNYSFDNLMADNPDMFKGFDKVIEKDNKITFEGIEGVHFIVEESKAPDGTTLFRMMAVREGDGRKFQVHDQGTTRQDAIDFGVEHLRRQSVRIFQQGLKTNC